MIEQDFLKRFNDAMALRGKTPNQTMERRAWQEIGRGQTDRFVDDALWHLERNQGANFATALAEARQHATERTALREDETGRVNCELCGGQGCVALPRLYRPGTYKTQDGVECKTIPQAKGYPLEVSRLTCIPAASICTCRGGDPLPQPILTTWRERKAYLEIAGRYETCDEWARRERRFILDEMLPPELVAAAEFPGNWAGTRQDAPGSTIDARW